MKMFINIANTACAIYSSEPAIRLCGTESDSCASIELSNESKTHWTCISENDKNIQTILTDWNSHREKICEDLYNAMNGQHNRNRRIVLFERIMSKYEKNKKVINRTTGTTVPKIDRNEEVRGQRFAILCIIGDAKYESLKAAKMEHLANLYIEHMCAILDIEEVPLNLSSEEDRLITAYFENDNIDIHDQKFLNSIDNDINEMMTIPNEPLISIWAISEDAEKLEEKSKKISEMPDMKHADVAVVTMYEWLYLESWKKFKVRRTSRDPRAEQFFKIMRERQETI